MHPCIACKIELPTSSYRTRKGGNRVTKCRPCENAYQREWSTREPEKYRERKRVSMAKRRAEDLEGARAYARLDHATNRDARTAKMREYIARRFFWGRAMKLRGANRATVSDVSRLWYAQRGACALTGRRLDRTAQLDHIIPKAKGGGDGVENLRWVCAAINYAKRDMSDDELGALCSDVMAWIGRRIAAEDARS